MERQHLSQRKNAITSSNRESALAQLTEGIARYSPHPIEELQGAIGNRAVNQLLANQPPLPAKPLFRGLSHELQPIQAKLTIGEVGDKYEQEADRVASQVVEQIHAPATVQPMQGQSVQRQEEPEEELQAKPSISDLQRSPLSPEVQPEAIHKDEDLQAQSTLQDREAIAGGEASTDLASAINRARESGQPLEAGLQKSMGQVMGADFSGVRVHTDAQSDQLNQSIQAKAFTTGQDVFFRQGEYQPGSRGGQQLIAHELTHVVQQNGGAVLRSPLSPQQLPQHPATKMAYTQGSDIYLEPQQELYLPREAWHIVQQNGIAVQLHQDYDEEVQMKPDLQLHQDQDKVQTKSQLQLHIDSKTQYLTAFLQRHPMPTIPQSLRPQVISNKKQWLINEIISSEEMNTLKDTLRTFIPANAIPSPEERIKALVFVDCPTPENMPQDSQDVVAKVMGETGKVYFNNSNDEYYNPDGSPNQEKIKATIVHEAFHATSAEHKGLQNYADIFNENSDPKESVDEAITDYFAIQTYQTIFKQPEDNYQSGYWVRNEKTPNASRDKKTDAQDRFLGVAWTGQLVGIIKEVLNVDDDWLKEVYFKDPTNFKSTIAPYEERLKTRWKLLKGEQALELHKIVLPSYKEILLEKVIKENIFDLRNEKDIKEKNKLVKQKLVTKGIPEKMQPYPYTTYDLNSKIPQVIKNEVGALPQELENVNKVTFELVNNLIQEDKKEVLNVLFSSNLFPLSVWEKEAWSAFLDYNSAIA